MKSNNIKLYLIFSAILALLVFYGCLGGGSGGGFNKILPTSSQTNFVLSGRVYFVDRSIYGNIPIVVKDINGKIVASTNTDSFGNFGFTTLAAGIYSLSAITFNSETTFETNIQIAPNDTKQLSPKSLLSLTSAIIDQVSSTSFRLTFVSNMRSKSYIEYWYIEDNNHRQEVSSSFITHHQVVVTNLLPSRRYGISIHLQSEDGQKYVYSPLSLITCSALGPSNLSFTIENGQIETRHNNVSLQIYAENANEMRISESEDMHNTNWEMYSTLKSYYLPAPDGIKRLFIQFRDILGNTSPIISDEIILNTRLEGYLGVLINGGKQFTNNLDVVLTLLYPTATSMRISNRNDFLYSFWETYSEQRKWRITPGDGVKTVYVQFNGGKANPNETFTASIILDTTGPETIMKINGGATKTNQKNVRLEFFPLSPVFQMQVKNHASFLDTDRWLPFASNILWQLEDGDGKKTVYARFKDELGNIYGPIEASINLDTTPPTLESFKIDDGATYTYSLHVKLTITASDANYVYVSNDDSFASAAVFSIFGKTRTIDKWQLNGFGLQQVFIKLVDDASNTTQIYSSEIMVLGKQYFNKPTVLINSDDDFTFNPAVQLTLFSPNSIENQDSMWISNNGIFSNIASEPYKTTKSWLLIDSDKDSVPAGPKSVYVKFTSTEGYVYASDSITLIGPASPTLMTIDSMPLNRLYVNLRLFAESPDGTPLTMKVGTDLSSAIWEPYSTTKILSFPTSGIYTVYAKFRSFYGVETSATPITVTILSNPPTGNTAVVREGFLSTSNEIYETFVSSLPVYLHFDIKDTNTASIAYTILPDTQPAPTTGFTVLSLPLSPIPLYEPTLKRAVNNIWYKFADGAGNWTSLQLRQFLLRGPSIKISPKAVTLYSNQSRLFTASLENISGKVLWNIISGLGTIDAESGLYTAPNSITNAATTTIRAYLESDPTLYDIATISLATQVELEWDKVETSVQIGRIATFVCSIRNSSESLGILIQPTVGSLEIATPPIYLSTATVVTIRYYAPTSVPSNNPVTMTVYSLQDPSKTQQLKVFVSAGPTVSVIPTSAVGQARRLPVTISATTDAYPSTIVWSIISVTATGSFSPTTVEISTTTYALIPSTPNPHTITLYPGTKGGTLYVEASWTDSGSSSPPKATCTVTVKEAVSLTISPIATHAPSIITPIAFIATVKNGDNGVNWYYRNTNPPNSPLDPGDGIARENGTLTSNGIYTRPINIPAAGRVIEIVAISIDDPTVSATATVTLLDPVIVKIGKGYNFTSEIASADVLLEVDTLKLIASVSNTAGDTTVTWYVNGIKNGNSIYGTIDNYGLYTAPQNMPSPNSFDITAVSNYDPTKSAKVLITLKEFWQARSKGLQDISNSNIWVTSLKVDPIWPRTGDTPINGTAPFYLFAGTNGFGVWVASADANLATEPADLYWIPTALATKVPFSGNQYQISKIDVNPQNGDIAAATLDGLYIIYSNNRNYNSFTKITSYPVKSLAWDLNDPRYIYLAVSNGIRRIKFVSANAPYNIDSEESWLLNVIYYLKETRTGQVGSPPVNTDIVAYEDPSKGKTLFNNSPRTLALSLKESTILYGGFDSGELGRFYDARTLSNPLRYVDSIHDPDPYDWFFIAPTGIASQPGVGYTLSTNTPPRPVNISPTNLGIIYDISVDPGNPNTLLVSTSGGIYRSVNAGVNFNLIASSTNCYATLIDPINVTYFFYGCEDGLYRSKNAGNSWTLIKSGLGGTKTIYTFTISPGSPGSTRRIWVGTSNGVYADGRSLDLD